MNYRLYTFVNYYLSDIQRGIQSAHLVHELVNAYYHHADTMSRTNSLLRSIRTKILSEWSISHKTMIVCNGGNSADLDALYDDIVTWQKAEDQLFEPGKAVRDTFNAPFEMFCEDKVSLNGALTCVGIVLPSAVYDAHVEPYGTQGDRPQTRVTPADDVSKEITYVERGDVDLKSVTDPMEVRARMIKKLKSYRLA